VLASPSANKARRAARCTRPLLSAGFAGLSLKLRRDCVNCGDICATATSGAYIDTCVGSGYYNGAPFAFLEANLTVSVPTPIVGAGLPGTTSVLTGAALLWWWRGRRRDLQTSKVAASRPK
jgi:hypothetical protein